MVIGITGKSGSGKTTITKYLNGNLENSTIVSVDLFVKNLILNYKKELIDIYGKAIIKEDKIDTFLFINCPEKQVLFFQKIFFELVEIIKNKIIQLQKIYTYVILDYFKLPELEEVWRICDFKILVEPVSDELRYQFIMQRNKAFTNPSCRSIEEELYFRDYSLPDFHQFYFDLVLINCYDYSLSKNINESLKLILEKERR